MTRIYIEYIGKPRDAHANAIAEEYVKRTGRYVRCEMREIKPERGDPWTRRPGSLVVLLDPAGRAMDSAGFTAFVSKADQDLVFVVGGAEGFPAGWKERAGLLLSLSPMTFAHELARVMLTEQLYRAYATLHGHPYAR